MMRFVLVVTALALVSAPALSEVGDNRDNFESLCQSCHVAQGRPAVAPPAFAVAHHVKAEVSERQAFIEWVLHWVQSPDVERSMMPGAVRRFGLMPRLNYREGQIRSAAAYLYDNPWQRPAWFEQHYREEHGRAPE